MFSASDVTLAMSVTFAALKPFSVHDEPPVHVFSVGATDIPLIVFVPEAPVETEMVGEMSRPLVVLVAVPLVASVNVKLARLPVSVALTWL